MFKVGDQVQWLHSSSVWQITRDLGNGFEIEMIVPDLNNPYRLSAGYRTFLAKSGFSNATLWSPIASLHGNVAANGVYTVPLGIVVSVSSSMSAMDTVRAVREAISKDRIGSGCECGNGKNPVGQGHSHWCKLFKQEF